MDYRRRSSRGKRDRENREEESVLHAPEPCCTEGVEKGGMTRPVGTETHTVSDRREKENNREVGIVRQRRQQR